MKLRSKAQRVGALGESVFRKVAEGSGLIPNKVEQDYGFDFFCEVEGKVSHSGIAVIKGSVLGVSVRSTQGEHGRIRLSRKDVERFLNCGFPVLVALVHLRAKQKSQVYFRLVDRVFATELARFIESERKSITFTPKSFKKASLLPEIVTGATEPGFAESVQLAVARFRASGILPDVRIEVKRSPDQQISLVRTSDFLAQFQTGKKSDEAVRRAVFGSQELMVERFREIPIRKELKRSLEPLPLPVFLVGELEEKAVTLEARGPEGTAKCEFRVRLARD